VHTWWFAYRSAGANARRHALKAAEHWYLHNAPQSVFLKGCSFVRHVFYGLNSLNIREHLRLEATNSNACQETKPDMAMGAR
jgi:hypothetical protein